VLEVLCTGRAGAVGGGVPRTAPARGVLEFSSGTLPLSVSVGSLFDPGVAEQHDRVDGRG